MFELPTETHEEPIFFQNKRGEEDKDSLPPLVICVRLFGKRDSISNRKCPDIRKNRFRRPDLRKLSHEFFQTLGKILVHDPGKWLGRLQEHGHIPGKVVHLAVG